ncbi:MAG: DUF3465 domain-containing protein [Neisseriaceae bacterium]|nr:DUF3465 domain-containing protein [Neisseriaceae bacterium]
MKTLIIICVIMAASIMGYNQYKTNEAVSKPVSTFVNKKFSRSVQNAYNNHKKNVHVKGRGKVANPPTQHEVDNNFQTFNVRLKDNHIVSIHHNLQVSKFIPDLQEGDDIKFSGEYRYTDEGGEIYFTHKDPKKQHADGWIEHNNIKYQ